METEENLIVAPWTRKWVPIHFSFLPITYTGSVLWCRKQTVEPLKQLSSRCSKNEEEKNNGKHWTSHAQWRILLLLTP